MSTRRRSRRRKRNSENKPMGFGHGVAMGVGGGLAVFGLVALLARLLRDDSKQVPTALPVSLDSHFMLPSNPQMTPMPSWAENERIRAAALQAQMEMQFRTGGLNDGMITQEQRDAARKIDTLNNGVIDGTMRMT